jgi:hypothetical protein
VPRFFAKENRLKARYRLLICAALVAAPVLFAQTYDFAQPPGTPAGQVFTCSPGGGLYCYGLSLYLGGDNTQPESTVWVDIQSLTPGYNYGVGFVCFPPSEENAVITPTPLSPYGCNVRLDANTLVVQNAPYTLPAYPKVTDPSLCQPGNTHHCAMMPVAVAFSFGSGLGTMAMTLDHYYTGGRVAWHTTVTAATLEIGAPSGSAHSQSPIAPTPTCLPPGCPPKDWGN